VKRNPLVVAAAAVVVLVLGVCLSGCVRQAPPARSAQSLIGAWFDDRTGLQYRFVSDSVLVVPGGTSDGGNALTYSPVGTGSIDVVSGGAHRVSVIDVLTLDRLVLADPLTDERQLLLRDAGRTTFVSELAKTAVEHASTIGSITAEPDILWVADMPTGKNVDWTTWSASSLDTYASAWDWASVKRAKAAPIGTAGGGSNIAFTFTLERKPPTAAELDAARSKAGGTVTPSSAEPTAGLKYIDVGYSASKAEYAAGSLVYVRGGLIYSLGDGYAIPVCVDQKTRSFAPATHD
jgi:hypothetical protein